MALVVCVCQTQLHNTDVQLVACRSGFFAQSETKILYYVC